jgi:ubiquinone biosynthesis protein UbiJ
MSDIVKVDDNGPPPSPAETWMESRVRKAKAEYELNKILRLDRAEEADLQSRELDIKKRKLDLRSFEHNLDLRISEDAADLIKRSAENYEKVKGDDDLAEEFGSIESLIARKERKTIEDWSAR